MHSRTWVARATASATVTVMLAAALMGAGAGPAAAGKKASARFLLSQLKNAPEHTRGYDRDKFKHWVDTRDADRCDARDEVLIAEATIRPRVSANCDLSGGQWRSRYDGVTTGDPSWFDVDHLVALNEAWQSGAWRWSSERREAFANDIGYKFSLIAVTASTNRSKSDREPQDWMPQLKRCAYLKAWVAVKWRWNLRVNAAERAFLRAGLKDCGWPRVARPARPVINALLGSSNTDTGGGGGGTGGGGGGGACAPGYSPCVPPYPPDLDCPDVGGPIYVTGSDPHGLDADNDGVACES